MGSKHSRPSSYQPAVGESRADVCQPSSNQHEDEISAEARAEFTVEDIHNPDNTRRAQELRSSDNDRFCKFRNYFKNHHMSLAREVGRKTSKSKAELLTWVEDAVGPLENADKYTKDEILEIAMVSAAITEYGERALTKMYDRGELDALPNVPLHTHNLRMPGQQQKCRNSSDAANKDQLEAAHYIGLEVMLRLNERLPVEQRMGEELREILNHPSNLRLMLASSNQILHKKVDAMLITATRQRQRKIPYREYERLVQIAKHAQDEGFQNAMIAANGHFLYKSLREQFKKLDFGDRPQLWDIQKDKLELRTPPRSRSRSPTPTPLRKKTPPSPEKKSNPQPRIALSPTLDSSATSSIPESEHRSTFSRLAAKIFRSRTKKKHSTSGTQSASTSTQGSSQPRSSKTKVALDKRQVPLKKTNKHAVPAPRKTNTSNQVSRKTKNSNHRTRRKATGSRSKQTPSRAIESSHDSDSDYNGSVSSGDGKNKGRTLHVGPRGGKYYINSAGKKVYVK